MKTDLTNDDRRRIDCVEDKSICDAGPDQRASIIVSPHQYHSDVIYSEFTTLSINWLLSIVAYSEI
jgi:hypothetical protein